MKIIKKTFIVLLIISHLFCLGACIFSKPSAPEDPYIFDKISECEKIYGLNYANQSIEEYDSPVADKNLNGLEYAEFFAAEYSSDELSFEIFAYRFESAGTSKEYFHNATGISTEFDSTFCASWGVGDGSIVVISGNKAYTVYTNSRYKDDINTALSQIFSVKLHTGNISSG